MEHLCWLLHVRCLQLASNKLAIIWRNHHSHLHNYVLMSAGFPRILESIWKYLNFFVLNSRPWKYLKTGQVLESPQISFQRCLKVLEFAKLNYAISAASLNNVRIALECICFTYLEICQVFCLTQDLLIIVMFCFCQLKLFCNHRNRYYMLL